MNLYNKKKISTFSKYVGKYKLDRKLGIRNYRLLSAYVEKSDPYIANLKKGITNNEKWDNRKNKQPCRSSSYKEEFNRQYDKHKYLGFEVKTLSDFERILFSHLDYIEIIKEKTSIGDKTTNKKYVKSTEYEFLCLIYYSSGD
ncbi:hypothetical protein MKS88_000576 [Plasmodium brasilianum]|uniref:Uncharacterized protein n=1 Tax=Plasmodium brasilianum TaxID=5824 RepID=A0ACB9YHM4_PLABR|nr:hypothetical protein MKS88_000576 [Plasmodium brasilianum]